MEFSDTTNKNGLIQDCEVLTNLGDGTISGNTVLLAQFTNLINQAYLKAVSYMLEAASTWEWDDSNYTDFPIGTTDLVDTQQDYQLPVAQTGDDESTLLKIIRVEVLNNSGDLVKLDPFDETEIRRIGLSEYNETDGMPRMYREVANSIELYPAPAAADVTTSNGLKVYFQRTPDLFTTSDTTQSPGIPMPFHRFLSLQASLDYAGVKGTTAGQYLVAQYQEILALLKGFESNKNRDVKRRVRPRMERYN